MEDGSQNHLTTERAYVIVILNRPREIASFGSRVPRFLVLYLSIIIMTWTHCPRILALPVMLNVCPGIPPIAARPRQGELIGFQGRIPFRKFLNSSGLLYALAAM